MPNYEGRPLSNERQNRERRNADWARDRLRNKTARMCRLAGVSITTAQLADKTMHQLASILADAEALANQRAQTGPGL